MGGTAEYVNKFPAYQRANDWCNWKRKYQSWQNKQYQQQFHVKNVSVRLHQRGVW